MLGPRDRGQARAVVRAVDRESNDFRGPTAKPPFGPAVEATASSSAADKLAAFLGRPP